MTPRPSLRVLGVGLDSSDLVPVDCRAILGLYLCAFSRLSSESPVRRAVHDYIEPRRYGSPVSIRRNDGHH